MPSVSSIINKVKKRVHIHENYLNYLINSELDVTRKQVLDRGVIGETYCIGGNNEFSNIQIAKIICEKLDLIRSKNKSYLDQIVFTEDRKGHDFRYAINNNKIKNNLNWEPNESFETGINKTIDWFLEYYKL